MRRCVIQITGPLQCCKAILGGGNLECNCSSDTQFPPTYPHTHNLSFHNQQMICTAWKKTAQIQRPGIWQLYQKLAAKVQSLNTGTLSLDLGAGAHSPEKLHSTWSTDHCILHNLNLLVTKQRTTCAAKSYLQSKYCQRTPGHESNSHSTRDNNVLQLMACYFIGVYFSAAFVGAAKDKEWYTSKVSIYLVCYLKQGVNREAK